MGGDQPCRDIQKSAIFWLGRSAGTFKFPRHNRAAMVEFDSGEFQGGTPN